MMTRSFPELTHLFGKLQAQAAAARGNPIRIGGALLHNKLQQALDMAAWAAWVKRQEAASFDVELSPSPSPKSWLAALKSQRLPRCGN
ncbi:hypothetical protein ACLKA7_013953 [Drosophila subpalustris]